MAASPRQWALRCHRWAGLFLAGFLIITGATGALLAFKDSIEGVLAPHLMRVEPFGQPLPLGELVRAAEAQLAPQGGKIGFVRWPQAPDHSLVMFVSGGELDYDELFLNPYSAEILGHRSWGAWRLGGEYVMPLVYLIHYSLAIPGEFGLWLLGVVAIIWLFDSFVGLYLTLPRRRQKFWQKWRPSWKIEWRAGLARRVRDLHVAVSLWVWGLFLVFAASSVMLNLHDAVYEPLISRIMPYRDVHAALPTTAPDTAPISWTQAHALARRAAADWAEREGFTIERESALGFNARGHYYQYRVHASWDLPESYPQTHLYIDAATGAVIAREAPYVDAGNALTHWLSALHMGKVFGTWYQVVVAIVGSVVVLASVTGLMIWRRKQVARMRTRPVREAAGNIGLAAARGG